MWMIENKTLLLGKKSKNIYCFCSIGINLSDFDEYSPTYLSKLTRLVVSIIVKSFIDIVCPWSQYYV